MTQSSDNHPTVDANRPTHDEDVRLNPMSDKYDWLRCLAIGNSTDYCAIPKGALRDYVALHDALMEEHEAWKAYERNPSHDNLIAAQAAHDKVEGY